jgi:hypothetical protein
VAFEYIDYLHDLAVGLGGEIAEENQIAFEWAGADVDAQFWAGASEQSGERGKMFALGDDLAREAHSRIAITARGNVAGDIGKILFGAVKEAKSGTMTLL